MDPHTSQQHAGLHHAVWQLQQEVTRPRQGLNLPPTRMKRVFLFRLFRQNKKNSDRPFMFRTRLKSTLTKFCRLPSHDQSERIGSFLKDLGYKFFYKSSPNIWWLSIWKLFLIPNCCSDILGNFGPLLIPTSGHTRGNQWRYISFLLLKWEHCCWFSCTYFNS